ncbi:hypothetical protein [Nocardioides sp.]|uniref:hypothetical protein n=1 Tax=Nocardioides sp. TaxID=35761 RepID=UPI0035AE4225
MIIFDEQVSVHYGFIHVFSLADDADGAPTETGEFDGDPVQASRGQTVGLAGARVPHQLSLMTGLHTGDVPLTVTWDEEEPPLDDVWTDAVEVSWQLLGPALDLQTFEDDYTATVPRAGWHRARYCAAGMDAGREVDTTDEDEQAPDRYLLQLWPAPESPEALVREGSEIAAYWHRVARGEGT